MEDKMPFIVRLTGYQKIHIVWVEVVVAGRVVAILNYNRVADDDERQQRPHQQNEMTANGKPSCKCQRHVATPSKETGRIGIRVGAGQEVEASDVQTSSNFIRVVDDRKCFEAPKRKVSEYD